MLTESQPVATTLGSIAAILQAVTWPLVAVLFFVIYRAKVGAVIDIFADKIKEAKHVKAWQVEIDARAEVDRVVNEAGQAATVQEVRSEVPEEQIRAARLVNEKLTALPIAYEQRLAMVRDSVYELVEKYESLRRSTPGGEDRTRIMNQISAKMRALAIGAYPLLPSLMEGKRPGERLAAICILQVQHDPGRFHWLIDRVEAEDQPFLFFNAALAILEIVRDHQYLPKDIASKSIGEALSHLKGFRGGKPDQNTIDVLEEALRQLR
jgi:hypothetical protein